MVRAPNDVALEHLAKSGVAPGELKSIIKALTVRRISDAERIEELENELQSTRTALHLVEQMREAHLALEVEHEKLRAEYADVHASYIARASELRTTEKDCKVLRKELDAANLALHRMMVSGGQLADSTTLLFKAHENRPPSIIAEPGSEACRSRTETGMIDTATEAQAIAHANFATVLDSYETAVWQLETLGTAVRAVAEPLGQFRAAMRAVTGAPDDSEDDELQSAEVVARRHVQRVHEEIYDRIKQWEDERHRNRREANRLAGQAMRQRRLAQEALGSK